MSQTAIKNTNARVHEDVYTGELVRYPGPWGFQIGKSVIILVKDSELEALSDPDKVLDLSVTYDKVKSSLRQVCEKARAAGHRTLIIAFDHFFAQYRPGQSEPRRLMPDSDEYIRRIAGIGKFAASYGLGLELSLLSPLEVGKAFRARTGESGLWMHYRKGLRDPKSGVFSVQLWQQRQWVNNKGPTAVEDAGIRVFAFRESPVPGAPYRVVDPGAMVDITKAARVEVWEGTDSRRGYEACRIRIHGRGMSHIGDLDRVIVIQKYVTTEMDYFSPRALPFLKKLVDRYADAGVKLNSLYADEMHIQQDWFYHEHHDHGQFALRYVSDGLARRFADRHGASFRDLAKYMLYFVYDQEDFSNSLSAKAPVMHVFGASPEAIRATALFRANYYRLLQDGVVDLFVAAKQHAESRMGHLLEARAHATWAESPCCDKWETQPQPETPQKYEYTSNFVWSNTVQQSAAACSDYFKWNDFLTGGGNDHAEGGWLDRDYFGLALACSTGILNRVPYAYAAHWGMPQEIHDRRMALVNAYGAAGASPFGLVQDLQHRDVDVLMLYPIDLVAAEERFGSWMTQYGYANYVTAAKLLERGRVVNGGIEMAGRRFTTLMTTFEPFPSKKLLAFLRDFAERGGRLIWAGPPPVLTAEGGNARAEWQKLFGVRYTPSATEGYAAPGKQVEFAGVLKHVSPQAILTDFLVDRVYPVTPAAGVQPAARVKQWVVGTHRKLGRSGTATFLGFRLRDDQSKSLGYDCRTLFDVLSALGAYPETRAFRGVNDNTEHLSRTGDVLCCRFPNGALALAPHLREMEESWDGGFARDKKRDRESMARNPPPSDRLKLNNFKVNGLTVSYTGRGAVCFRVDKTGELVAFTGAGSNRITVGGHQTIFAAGKIQQLAWAPVLPERSVDGKTVLQAIAYGAGKVRIPASRLPRRLRLFAEGPTPGSRGEPVQVASVNGALEFTVTARLSGKWLYAAV